jgi:hypothetical protein
VEAFTALIYEGRPYDELVALLYQRDAEKSQLLELWKKEQQARIAAEDRQCPPSS